MHALLHEQPSLATTQLLMCGRDGTTIVTLLAGVSREHFIHNIKNALIRIAERRPSLYPAPAPAPVQPIANVQQQQLPYPQSPPPAVNYNATPTNIANSIDRPESPRGTPASYPSSPTAPPTTTNTVATNDAAAASAAAEAMSSGRRGSVRPSFGEQQRLKKVAEQAERQRILQLLEYDKAERRLRDKERRESVVITEQLRPRFPEVVVATGSSGDSGKGDVALSFRLTDGSNVKFRFPPEATLGVDVRAWIEKVFALGRPHRYHR